LRDRCSWHTPGVQRNRLGRCLDRERRLGCATGSENMKATPLDEFGSAQMRPPCERMPSQMGRPRPMPVLDGAAAAAFFDALPR